MAKPSVLISGAGIAGNTLAYWLSRYGFRTTLVERARDLHSGGGPVDVRGPALDVAERMGIIPRLQAAATHVTGMRFIDARGRSAGCVDILAFQRASGRRDIEIPRGDLVAILRDTSQDHAELLFDDSVIELAQDEGGVDVIFGRARPRRFDWVIGADGLHSAIRRLVFGPEDELVKHLGLYIATLPLPRLSDVGGDIVMFNAPGRLVAIHPSRGQAGVAFIFWSPQVADFDRRDTTQHQRILSAVYRNDGWRVPEFLDDVRVARDLYFDSVSRVRAPTWSRGRIALLGDAASCVSLFGDGSTLAMTGAFTLAEALSPNPIDHGAAFQEYETRHRALVEPRQRNLMLGASLLIPKTQAGITLRNLALHLWPVVAAAGRVHRRVTEGRNPAA